MVARLNSSSWRLAPFDTARPQDGLRIRGFFRTSAGRVFAGTIACWIVAFIFCHYQFWRDPHSAFFDSSAAYEMKYTLTREAEAKMLIDSAEAGSNPSRETSADPVICAGIISVKRRDIQYLNGTVGSLLVGLTDEERNALNVQVFFADLDPSVHPDYGKEWLSLVDFWSGYNISEEQMAILREYKEAGKLRPKAIFDYVYMLEQCYNKTDAPFIAVFEDDTIFADSWLAKTLLALADIRKKRRAWLYLRLWWTDVMLGWDKEIDPWYTNPILNYMLSLSLVYTVAYVLQKRLRRIRPQTDIGAVMVLTCFTVPAFITLIFMIGRNSLFPMAGLQRMDAKGCCTQALIYNRSQVLSLKYRLLEFVTEPDQTDFIIEDYANERELTRYALAPQLVQHVGLVSSRGTKTKNSQTNWSFYFETFSAKRLRKEHDRLADSALSRASHELLEPPIASLIP